jgi:hypothetical protein
MRGKSTRCSNIFKNGLPGNGGGAAGGGRGVAEAEKDGGGCGVL